MNKLSFFFPLFAAAAIACTPAEVTASKAIVDVTGAVCQVVLTSTDPALAPICTTADNIVIAVETLLTTGGPDGGALGASAPGMQVMPSQQAIYSYLVAHGAQLLKQ